jgi:signal peptidase I
MEPGFSFMAYFEEILTFLVIISGLIYLFDALFWAKARAVKNDVKMPWYVEYSRSFFPVLLIVLLIRSFGYELYRIPSGSLKPTLQVGDLILVNKFDYGFRLPVIHTKVIPVSEPKTGDIVVFRSPTNPRMDLIKRVVGVPGDHISYINKVLYINGKEMPQTYLGDAQDHNEDPTSSWAVNEKSETLAGVQHHIYVRPDLNESGDFQNIIVPPNSYFMMGDNRDDSNDSRFWGFMPEANIIGKADYILLSWNGDDHKLRLSRSGQKVV